MKYEYFEVSDGCKIAFQTSLPLDVRNEKDSRYETMILLIHGFAGSSALFNRTFESLSSLAWIVAIDLRGHGQSAHSAGGYHLGRLAADLKETIAYLRDRVPIDVRIVPAGSSLGAAVLWTYHELFPKDGLAGMIFIDQIPFHDKSIPNDWNQSKAHYGFFDDISLLVFQNSWIEDLDSTAKSVTRLCLGYRFAPRPDDAVTPEQTKTDEDFFLGESQKCDGVWLARLLGDHVRYDHREACERIRFPTLTMAGRRSGLWPLEGPKETVRLIKKGLADQGEQSSLCDPQWVEFDSGHFLYWEEPTRFCDEIKTFLKNYVMDKS